MGRLLSAAQLKQKGRGRVTRPPQRAPREGSLTRFVYDVLMENRGRPIGLELFEDLGITYDKVTGIFQQLRLYYGLDVRSFGMGRWILGGEWEGSVYVDYVVEQRERGE